MTYVIPAGSLEQTAMQEEISKAYVHMVASAAGITIQRWDTDYGAIDLTLKSLVDYGCPGGFQPSFDIQLKATTQNVETDQVARWQIDRRTYEKLTNPNRSLFAVFAILLLPNDPVMWLAHNTEGLLARSHMYWLRASDFPTLPEGQQSLTLSVPKRNVFSPANVLVLMEEASRRWFI